jgi:hypothetical protein
MAILRCPYGFYAQLFFIKHFFRNLRSGPIFLWKAQVPNSQRSLRENPKFLQNFKSKNTTLMEIVLVTSLISAIVIQAWHSKVKTKTLLHKIVCIS